MKKHLKEIEKLEEELKNTKELQFLMKEINKIFRLQKYEDELGEPNNKRCRNKMAEQIIQNFKDKPGILHSTNHKESIIATYYPFTDGIIIYPRKYFKKQQNYYHSIFHEFAHATGHETRLKRNPIGRKRCSKQVELYEELTAEFAAILLCKKCKIFKKTNSAQQIYKILSEIKELNLEKRIKAFQNAKQAVNYILGEIK